MRLLLLDDEGIMGYLQQLDNESRAARKEIAEMVIFSDGRIQWNDAWMMSREDRLNLSEATHEFNKNKS